MSVTLKQLFERLPAEIRRQDHLHGARVFSEIDQSDRPGDLTEPQEYGPIKSLLSAILREGQHIERDIQQLYDDHFIETCADWVVPYIGELVGALALEPVPSTDNHRRFVAATLATRRSKGTLATLEYTAAAATGWPVYAVEYWKRTASTPSMRRPEFVLQNTIGVKNLQAMEQIGSAFEQSPRCFHARSVETQQGQWNLPNIGLHIFCQNSYRIGNGEIKQAGSTANTKRNYGHIVVATHAGSKQYRFHPLGCDAPLYRAPPDQNPSLGERRSAAQLPTPIRRFEFEDNIETLFGPNKAINIIVRKGANVTQIDPATIKAANLGSSVPNSGNEAWPITPKSGTTYIDPETGRFVLDNDVTGSFTVFVTFHEGRAISIGGHQRELSDIPELVLPGAITMTAPSGIPNVPSFPSGTDPLDIHFEHTSSYRFDGNRTGPRVHNVDLFRIIAMERAWPTLVITRTTGLNIDCKPGSDLLISGVRVRSRLDAGSYVKTIGDDVRVHIKDTTLVPGRDLNRAGDPIAPNRPSLRIAAGQTATIERSILGPIEMGDDVELVLNDCIIDAGDPRAKAIIPLPGSSGHKITLNRCTVIGQIKADRVGGGDHYGQQAQSSAHAFPIRYARSQEDEAEPRGIRDSLILAQGSAGAKPIDILDIQTGCVRHSYIPPGSRVPRKFACAPDNASGALAPPSFSSRRYLDPAYMQLSLKTSALILEGGSNGTEMGVGNDQNNRARRANLSRIIDDQLRFGLQAGPIYDT